MTKFLGGIALAAVVAFGVLMCTVAVVGCKKKPPPEQDCGGYAATIVAVCEHENVRREDAQRSDCASLYKPNYDNCKHAYEHGVRLCVRRNHGNGMECTVPP